MTLLPVAEALARILDGVEPTGVEIVPLLEARGRVLAVDLRAKLTQPPFASSAMDGYAVRAADVTAPPVKLKVIGVSAAGHGFRGRISAGEAVRIFTGAPLPAGTDAVVIQENVDADSDAVLIREAAKAATFVRARGLDFEEGQILLRAGRVLDAHALTLAAAMGHDVLPVRRRPTVAILATGDELVAPGVAPDPDQIISSNPIGLAALVEQAGGTPRLLGIARDTEASIAMKIAEAEDADVLVTIGGASVGEHDLVAPALKARGMRLDFWRIAMRPGKPLLFGRLGKTRVLGFPGNPVSALLCGRVFLEPLIRALLGVIERNGSRESARLTHNLEANGQRLHLMRAKLSRSSAGELCVTALASQDSSLISALAAADCLIVRAPFAPEARAGSSVEIQRLEF